MTDPRSIAASLSEAQKRAVLYCIEYLELAAGEGVFFRRDDDTPVEADTALFDLWNTFFDEPPEDDYWSAIRAILQEEKGEA